MKFGSLSKHEREVLKEAGKILGRLLAQEKVVRIPDFGKFVVGTKQCTERPPDGQGDNQKFLIRVVRFRPFSRFREMYGGYERTFLS